MVLAALHICQFYKDTLAKILVFLAASRSSVYVHVDKTANSEKGQGRAARWS